MRNAALVLGIIAGLFAMVVGFFSYGWTVVTAAFPEAAADLGVFANPILVKVVSIGSPSLAIGGGAMAKVRALWAGIMLLISAAGMQIAFGFNVATMFPIAMAGLGGVLALAAGKPDEPKAHF